MIWFISLCVLGSGLAGHRMPPPSRRSGSGRAGSGQAISSSAAPSRVQLTSPGSIQVASSFFAEAELVEFN
jgi:hypothetical protein